MKRISLFLVGVLLMVGCASVATISPTPTNIPVSPSPSATATEILPTPIPSATFTVTPIQTLPVGDAQAKLLKFLSDNSGCYLPCLWGIAPGESSFQEAQVILIPLGSVSEFTAFKSGLGSVTPYFIEGGIEIYTTIDLIANQDNNIVNHIAFNAEAHRPLAQGGYENVFDSKFFGEKVRAYALPHVLSEQGVPSSVMLATYGSHLTRGGTGGFDILLLYPKDGILVNYTTQMHLIGTNVRGCPVNAHVEMELYPPGQTNAFFESLKTTDWAVKMNYYKPLDEVTSMSVNEFYQTFREPTDKCIETLAKLWPIPEP